MTGFNIEWLFLKIYNLFFSVKDGVGGGDFSGFKATIGFILTLVSLVFIGVIIYSTTRLKETRAAEKDKLHEKIKAVSVSKKETKDDKHWKIVLDFITSNNPSDWRLAVIEADNMLDALTKELGLVGENLGERLKNAPLSHFRTLDNAWEAHKLRNRIAHEGMAYELEYREAKKAIENFETVFAEFDYI